MKIAVGTSTVVSYTEDVRYWEGPLSEVSLYFLNFCFFHAREVFIFPTKPYDFKLSAKLISVGKVHKVIVGKITCIL